MSYQHPFDTKIPRGFQLVRFFIFALISTIVNRISWKIVPLRWYYKRAPYAFYISQQLKFIAGRNITETVEQILISCNRAALTADKARSLGYRPEAGALYITQAWLYLSAFRSIFTLPDQENEFSKSEILVVLIDSFSYLAKIEELPANENLYWQDRLAEVTARLFEHLAPFPHSFPSSFHLAAAIPKVAVIVSHFIQYRKDAQVNPLPFGQFYMGGPLRIHALLAHLEVLGERSANAQERLRQQLHMEVPERDDYIYALIVALSSARKIKNMDLHQQWFQKLQKLIDNSRLQHRSAEGRIFEMQVLYNDFRIATEIWANDQLHHPEDLLAIAELIKARVTLDEINGCFIPPEKLGKVKLFEQEKSGELQETLASFTELSGDEQQQIRILSAAVSGYGMETSNPRLAAFSSHNKMMYDYYTEQKVKLLKNEQKFVQVRGRLSGTVQPYMPEDIRKNLREDELLIEYYIPRDPFSPNRECRIIIVDKKGVHATGIYIDPIRNQMQHFVAGEAIDRGPFSDYVASLRAAIEIRNDSYADELLKLLFRFLIQPVIQLGYLPEHYSKWIIVSHGPLHLLPFHALKDNEHRFLIERVAITTVPSASVWLHLNDTKRAAIKQMLCVGNPELKHHFGYNSLPDAEDEASRVASLFSAKIRSESLLGSIATETKVKEVLSSIQLVHFATHGELDYEDPRNEQKILLSKDENEDGALTSQEIRALDLRHIRLVTLNICNGAVCRYSPSDEPLGLLSAFLKSGVENIIGGLWELPDASSKVFILDFYRNLIKSGDPSRARQFAAKRAIDKNRNLLFWAGFELIGSGRPLFESENIQDR